MIVSSPVKWWRLRCHSYYLLALWWALCAPVLAGPEPKPQPIAQPLPFSHKTHAAAGLACLDCHAGAKAKESAGVAPPNKCMFCHISIKADSEPIRKLAQAQKSGQAIPWVRVYRVPAFVFFSHASHAKAGVECVTCHGPVAERDVLSAEISTKMQMCVNCHTARKASTECALCHQLGQ
jgi:hypothetical protein